MQTGGRQVSVNPDYEKRSRLTLGLFACFKTSKMESSITATPPSCQWKGEKGIISRRYVCLVIPISLSLFCECLASLLSQFFAMPKVQLSLGCISSQWKRVAPTCFVLHVSVCSIFYLFIHLFIFCNCPSLSNIQGSPCSNFLTGRVCFILMKHVTYVVRILYLDITTIGLCHLLERA